MLNKAGIALNAVPDLSLQRKLAVFAHSDRALGESCYAFFARAILIQHHVDQLSLADELGT